MGAQTRISRRRAARAWAIAVWLANVAIAQQGDPPGRVALVDVVEGQASVQVPGADVWMSDVINRPLTSGDKLWVDSASRVAMYIGSTAVHLGDQTGIELLDVGDNISQLRLSAGSMHIKIRSLANQEIVEVDTPNVAVGLLQAGEYRLDVDDRGDSTDVAVISGQAAVASAGQTIGIAAAQRAQFRGVGSTALSFGDFNGPDSLDLWAEQLDARADRAVAAQFVSTEVPGYTDLDDHGTWSVDPTYGPVWAPQVVVGWAPYQNGQWLWVAPWGWTWVEAAPWGFAPFHFGRWVYLNRAWRWSPGQRFYRPVYAPALVAWIGGATPGPGVSWVPLGFNEIYRPNYRSSSAYLQRVNRTNTRLSNSTVIADESPAKPVRYINQNAPGAVATLAHALSPGMRAHGSVARAATPAPAIFARPLVSRRVLPFAVMPHAEQPSRDTSTVYAPAPRVIETTHGEFSRKQPVRAEAAERVEPPVRVEPPARIEARKSVAVKEPSRRVDPRAEPALSH